MKPRSYYEDEDVPTFGTGTANASLYGWEPTKTERAKWKREQAAADKRKIPLGFVPQQRRKK